MQTRCTKLWTPYGFSSGEWSRFTHAGPPDSYERRCMLQQNVPGTHLWPDLLSKASKLPSGIQLGEPFEANHTNTRALQSLNSNVSNATKCSLPSIGISRNSQQFRGMAGCNGQAKPCVSSLISNWSAMASSTQMDLEMSHPHPLPNHREASSCLFEEREGLLYATYRIDY